MNNTAGPGNDRRQHQKKFSALSVHLCILPQHHAQQEKVANVTPCGSERPARTGRYLPCPLVAQLSTDVVEDVQGLGAAPAVVLVDNCHSSRIASGSHLDRYLPRSARLAPAYTSGMGGAPTAVSGATGCLLGSPPESPKDSPSRVGKPLKS